MADGYEETEVDVSAAWKSGFEYENPEHASVLQKITLTKGMKDLSSSTKTLTATHTVGTTLEVGDPYEIVSASVNYSYSNEQSQVSMTQQEIYASMLIEHTVTIPPNSKFIRWGLEADVGGAIIQYMSMYDEIYNTNAIERTPQVAKSTAIIRVKRKIHFGTTVIRIKHAERQQYMTVVHRKDWPAATLGHSNLYKFILQEDSRGIRIKTLNSTSPGYDFLYCSKQGGAYFDKGHTIGTSDDTVQHWSMSRAMPLHNGDIVTFKNKYYTQRGLGYYADAPATNIYGLEKLEDKWILEVDHEQP